VLEEIRNKEKKKDRENRAGEIGRNRYGVEDTVK
jgi:hypothetical protein